MATSTFRLWRRCKSSPQPCDLHSLRTSEFHIIELHKYKNTYEDDWVQITAMWMSMIGTRVNSMGMSVCMVSMTVGCVGMRVAMSGTGVWVTVPATCSAMWVAMMTAAAVLECKDADDVNDKAEQGHDEQSLVVDFGRLKQALQPPRKA